MLPKIILILTALLALGSGIFAKKTGKQSPSYHHADNLIDIDLYSMPMADEPVVAGSGSGSDKSDDDGSPDDDDFGSGSGSGMGVATIPEHSTPTTTSKALTPCEQLRQASKDLIGNFVPRCTIEGHYDTMQCRGYPGTGNCWCTDLDGRMIPSTNMGQPNVPDCDLGTNLKPCIYEIVKYNRKKLLGAYRPNCTLEGYFKAVQCHGSMCYCVTLYGKKIEGTEVFRNDRPNCQETTVDPSIFMKPTTTTEATLKVIVEEIIPELKSQNKNKTPKPKSEPEPETEYTESPEGDTKIKPLPESEDDVVEITSDEVKGEDSLVVPITHIMTQPGLLAAIIGGAVVTLLCAILLIMFIVYRMRKKDEGSYALDEPRKMPNYSYHRAEKDKEFYA